MPSDARDGAARLRAQTDFRVPLLVEAGAGSGKTSILVARIVAWSLGPGWEKAERWLREHGEGLEPDRVAQRTLSRVVAITFTEAAAAEMALRVGEWLGRLAAGDDPREIAAEALPPERVRRARAEALRSALDRLVVRTIHAFCRRLLAECPMDAGLHPAFEVDADEERMTRAVREVVEHAIPEAYADPQAPLSRLAVAGIGPGRIEEALVAIVRSGLPPERLQEDPFSPERAERFVSDLREASEAFDRIEAGRLVVTGKNHQAALSAIRETASLLAAPPPDVGALCDRLRELWDERAFGQLGSKWRKGDFSRPGKAALGEDGWALAEACARLHRLLGHARRVDRTALDGARLALAPLAAAVEERLRTSGVETFAALLRDTRALVESHPHVARRIRSGIDQLLVDEFQDTDDVQCAIVRGLALEGERDERPGLFLVGDPRQAIYGWRSADLRAYDAFAARIEAEGGTRLFLTRNFRSLPAVLDEVRRCIAPVMQERAGVQPAFQDLRAHRTREGRPGEVEHWISWHWDPAARKPAKTLARDAVELEARALAEDLARLGREGVAWRDVAVLFRAMTQVDAYLDALRDAGIPYTVERDRRYYQRREVIEASALLRSVLDPHDHVALVAWLRSAAVGVPDAAWIPLWTRGFPAALSALQAHDDETFARQLAEARGCIEAATPAVDPEIPGLERIAGWEVLLHDAVGTLADLRRQLHTAPADVFIEALRTATLVEVTEAARYLGPYRVANLDQFFRDVRDDLEETGGDVSEVLRRIRLAVESQAEVEEARPREAADDAVRVMSIHKAKGLDFPHVYLPQLHKGSGGLPTPTLLGRGAQQGEYKLFGLPTLGWGAAQEQADRIVEAESVRTLYVAMTRARDRLVLLGKDQTDGSHAGLLAGRRSRERTPEQRMVALAGRGEAAERDADGVLWRFPGLAPSPARRVAAPAWERALPGPDAVAAAADRLAERRAASREHQARPRSQPASAHSHEAARERAHARVFPVEGEPVRRSQRDGALAAAVGTALHAALERWPLDASREEGLVAARGVVAAALAAQLAESDRAPAERQAETLLSAFVASPLFERFVGLGERIVARELPVLLAPGPDDAALGHVAGAVDLLYRDEAGRLVVADYKSDVFDTEPERAERVARYAEQGAAYVRAVREALALEEPPRFELWFLSRGERVSVPARAPR